VLKLALTLTLRSSPALYAKAKMASGLSAPTAASRLTRRGARGVSRATSVSSPATEELLWRTAFRAFALRLRALANLLPARERRLIAFPKAQDKAS
jgi:hypothetical protein